MRLLFSLCLCAAASFAQTSPLLPGEKLEYDISWRIFPAGQAQMSLARDTTGPLPSWHATVEVHSTGIVSRLYKVEDVYSSTFQNGPLCSEQILKVIHEGSRHREIQIEFQRQRRMSVLKETDLAKNKLVRQAENPIPPCAFDVVSALYYVRAQKLEIGKSFRVPVNDGSHTILIDVEVQAREEVKTPAGVFQTIRVEPQVFGGTLFKKSGRMLLWLTEDPTHRLVQLKAKLFIGTITAVVNRVSY